jgi:pyruvate dehydrogenase E1 component
MAVIIQDGLRRMYQDQENVFYYITSMNENYAQPEMPKGVEEGIIKGMYLLEDGGSKEYKVSGKAATTERLRLLGSGTILREVREAAVILRDKYKVPVDVWSVTSFNELRREGMATTRHNMLHPSGKDQESYVTQSLKGQKGPVVAATDYMRLFADQIREYVPDTYRVLGTDGFGRSDTRKKLRWFFEVDRHYVVLAALTELKARKVVTAATVNKAMKEMGIDPKKVNPVLT